MFRNGFSVPGRGRRITSAPAPSRLDLLWGPLSLLFNGCRGFFLQGWRTRGWS